MFEELEKWSTLKQQVLPFDFWEEEKNETEEKPASVTGKVSSSGSQLRVRTGPGSGYAICGFLSDGYQRLHGYAGVNRRDAKYQRRYECTYNVYQTSFRVGAQHVEPCGSIGNHLHCCIFDLSFFGILHRYCRWLPN